MKGCHLSSVLERLNVQKKYRLKSRADFKQVYRLGKTSANRQLVVYCWERKDGGDSFRLGISVSKRIGNAVVRNRMRRRIKEIVRQECGRIKQEYDYIIIVRKGALQLDFAGLKRSVLHVLKNAKLLHSYRR